MPYHRPVGGRAPGVSILVVLDWTMMQLSVRLVGLAGWVSILVVLDWTMMRCLSQMSGCPPLGFNPCCIGLDNDAPSMVPKNRSS